MAKIACEAGALFLGRKGEIRRTRAHEGGNGERSLPLHLACSIKTNQKD